MIRAIRRFLDKFPTSEGLLKSGQWRVHYTDGNWSEKMTNDAAWDYADMFGGTVHWVRYDDPATDKAKEKP